MSASLTGARVSCVCCAIDMPVSRCRCCGLVLRSEHIDDISEDASTAVLVKDATGQLVGSCQLAVVLRETSEFPPTTGLAV